MMVLRAKGSDGISMYTFSNVILHNGTSTPVFCFFGKLVGLFEYSLNFLMDLCDITKQKHGVPYS